MISIVKLMLRYVSSITVNDDKVGFALQAFSLTILVIISATGADRLGDFLL